MSWLEILGVIFLVFLGGAMLGGIIVWAQALLQTQRDILSSIESKEDEEDEESKDETPKEGDGV